MQRIDSGDPKRREVIGWCLFAAGSLVVIAFWKGSGTVRLALLANGAAFALAAAGIWQRLPWSRWIVLAAIAPQLWLAIGWPHTAKWSWWVGAAALLWIGWLAMQLRTVDESDEPLVD